MIDCTFELNGRPMSSLKCGAISVPAFSGFGPHVNRRESVCLVQVGAIPPGTYYIFDRQSGGLLGPLKDFLSGRGEWFALFASDDKLDDETYCNQVRRGSFRLHPKGPLGISEGCIMVANHTDYQRLRTLLKSSPQVAVPGSSLKAYGRVLVK